MRKDYFVSAVTLPAWRCWHDLNNWYVAQNTLLRGAACILCGLVTGKKPVRERVIRWGVYHPMIGEYFSVSAPACVAVAAVAAMAVLLVGCPVDGWPVTAQGQMTRGLLFSPCRKVFQRANERTGINLPRAQCTHVLRHTFASYFIMNGGNFLVLRDILGHAVIKMTMAYAHFASEHLEDAVTKKTLSNLSWKRK